MNLNEQINALKADNIDLAMGWNPTERQWWVTLDLIEDDTYAETLVSTSAGTFEQAVAKAYELKFGVWPR